MSSDSPDIAVVGGTGHEGRGLAMRFARSNAAVWVGSRDAARAVDIAAELSTRVAPAVIRGASNRDAIHAAQIVVLAVPFVHAAETIALNRDAFQPGALVVDVTVPIVFENRRPRLVPPPEGSAAEHLKGHMPPGVQLAAAFKTLPAHLLESLDEPLDCDEFVCGDSEEARARTSALVSRLPGLRPVDAGPLEASRALESMTWLAIVLNKRHKRHGARFRAVGL